MRILLPLAFSLALGAGLTRVDDVFTKDEPAERIASKSIGSAASYDADVLTGPGLTWFTWLEHVPGEGDALVLGARHTGKRADGGPPPVEEERVQGPARLARPRLTRVSKELLWLTYEEQSRAGAAWHVYARPIQTGPAGTLGAIRAVGDPIRVSPAADGEGSDAAVHVDHDAARAPDGRLWVVWQSARPVDEAGRGLGFRGHQFDVAMRVVPKEGEDTATVTLSTSPYGDWSPRIAFTPDGYAWVVWDAFDGESFNVVGRRHEGDAWSPTEAIAATPAFEGRASIEVGPRRPDGTARVWVAFERGPLNWGRTYRSVSMLWNNVTDEYGPLHRFSSVHLVEWSAGRGVAEFAPLPSPSFDAARAEKRRDGVRDVGVFYERPEVAVDGYGRPWVAYRHFTDLQVGRAEPVKHHIESGWDVYARALTDAGWSPLFAFDRRQRDGAQRLSISPSFGGIVPAWTTGRTDRRPDGDARGLAHGIVEVGEDAGEPPAGEFSRAVLAVDVARAPRRPPAPAKVAGETFELVFGDLHRHTDLSLCFPFYDGSLDDAYRYGIEVARLDFLGVTDHARDLAEGDVNSQVWWRTLKAVERSRLPGAFIPYYAFERSHGDTDHNVISLRGDMLRNFPPPLPEFWAEITDADTITIPHNTVPKAPFCGKIWEHHDDAKRPLVEVFQGFRDRAVVAEAAVGLDRGYHMGFIGSSDHLSTSGAYACVWTPEREREAVFRALQARRTYAATAPIRLVVTAGDAWMGERLEAELLPRFAVEVEGTAEVERIELVVGGEVVEAAEPDAERWAGTLRPPARVQAVAPNEEIWAYVHILQADGEEAWSSPIWFTNGG